MQGTNAPRPGADVGPDTDTNTDRAALEAQVAALSQRVTFSKSLQTAQHAQEHALLMEQQRLARDLRVARSSQTRSDTQRDAALKRATAAEAALAAALRDGAADTVALQDTVESTSGTMPAALVESSIVEGEVAESAIVESADVDAALADAALDAGGVRGKQQHAQQQAQQARQQARQQAQQQAQGQAQGSTIVLARNSGASLHAVEILQQQLEQKEQELLQKERVVRPLIPRPCMHACYLGKPVCMRVIRKRSSLQKNLPRSRLFVGLARHTAQSARPVYTVPFFGSLAPWLGPNTPTEPM